MANTLKDYYTGLQQLYSDALTMIQAINNSFTAYSPTVSFNVDGEDYTIPSFLYLENKINEVSSVINTLFNMPKSGDGWFTKEGNTYKFNMLQSNLEPLAPSISLIDQNFNITQNNIFKDLVNPKTYVRLDIGNTPQNISEFLLKKIVLLNDDLIADIFGSDEELTYSNFVEKAYLLVNGVDYVEYDTTIKRPLKEYMYDSKFEILEVFANENGDTRQTENVNGETRIYYKLRINTLKYYNKVDKSLTYTLKVGDYLTLPERFGIYEVTNIEDNIVYDTDNDHEYIITITEQNGHNVLKDITRDSSMYFMIHYNQLNTDNNYIDVSLEENPYIVVFLSSIYNNVKSNWSTGVKINLNEVYIYDSLNNKQVNYLEYYDKYCKNIGDIIYSISDIIYPQLVKYSAVQLKELTTGKIIQTLVTDTLKKNNNPVLTISAINKHVIDDDMSTNLTNLHKEKLKLLNDMSNIQNNIDSLYNKITTTDFSVNVTVSKTDLNKELSSYYTEKQVTQQKLLTIVDNIDAIKTNVIGYDNLKFRVRGVTSVSNQDESGTDQAIVEYLKTQYGYDCELIGLEVEYKYKNVNSNTSTIENNSNTLFTDWNRIANIDKQRYLKFDNATGTYEVEYVNYDTNLNTIKWNQIDIPISFGEDVVIRIRYKYNIGQPFINIYTPWSDEVTVSYDEDMLNVSDITSILNRNEQDVYNSIVLKELINGGFQEHIDNRIIDNSAVFYHQPENIYSGFYTADNKLISLKDKLYEMENELQAYKELIDSEINEDYKVYFVYDDNVVELYTTSINKINVLDSSYDISHFIKKDAKIVIKNTGSTPVKLYSIFPGNTEIPLLHTYNDVFNDQVGNYERVPLLQESVEPIQDSIYTQKLGQWLYFRQNNVYTQEKFYDDSERQNGEDQANLIAGNPLVCNSIKFSNVINGQQLLAKRYRGATYEDGGDIDLYVTTDETLVIDAPTADMTNGISYNKTKGISKFIYKTVTNESEATNNETNSFAIKYEHLVKELGTEGNKNTTKYLTERDTLINVANSSAENDILQKIIANNKIENIDDLYGAILVPTVMSNNHLLCENYRNNQFKKIDVGESLTIPICLEYFLPMNKAMEFVRSLSFDIKPSLLKPVRNYILTLNISNNISEMDDKIYYTPQTTYESDN